MSLIVTELFKFILLMFTSLLNIVLVPIDILLQNVIPNFTDMSGYASDFLNHFFNDIIFVLEWIHIPYEAVLIIMGYVSLRVTLFLSVMGYRLFIRWFSILSKGV